MRIKATTHYIGIAVFAGFEIEVLSVAVSFVVQVPSSLQDALMLLCQTYSMTCLLSSYSFACLLANSHNSAIVDGQ